MSDDQKTPDPVTLDHLSEVAKRASGLLPVDVASNFDPVAHMSVAPSVPQPSDGPVASQQTTPRQSQTD